MFLFKTDNEEKMQQELRIKMQVPESCQILFGKGLAHSYTEVTRGLYSVFSHKMVMSFYDDTHPLVDKALGYFSREGFKTYPYSYHGRITVEKIIQDIGKSCLFFATSKLDPLTGELFDHSLLQVELEKLKTVFIEITDASLQNPKALEVGPYNIKLFSITHDLSVAILGERVRIDRLHFDSLYFSNESVRQVRELNLAGEENKAEIQKFETACGSFCDVPLLARPRVYDRAVLSFKDIDSSALAELLIEQEGLSQGDIEVGSLCKWQDARKLQWLAQQGFSPEQIRGLVIIRSKAVSSQLASAVETHYRAILKLQS